MHLKKTIILTFSLSLILLFSCIDFIRIDQDDNNNGTDSTDNGIVPSKVNWVNAGITSSGEGSEHPDLCRYKDKLFTSNVRGDLYGATFPELNWSKIDVPCAAGDHIYSLIVDTTRGCLYMGTGKLSRVFEYNINTESWRKLSPAFSEWFDTTKYVDEEEKTLKTTGKEIISYKDKLYFMVSQDWDVYGGWAGFTHIYCSNFDTNWILADSGWITGYPNHKEGDGHTITEFVSVYDKLYATTYEDGIWVYENDTYWRRMGGTYRLLDKDYDGKLGPGIHCRSMVGYKGDVYATQLRGQTYKLLADESWEYTGDIINIFPNGNDEYRIVTNDRGLQKHTMINCNGYLIEGVHYYDSTAHIWQYMIPGIKMIHPRYNSPLAGSMMSLVTFGDTLFVASASAGDLSGVYYLDLSKLGWYKPTR